MNIPSALLPPRRAPGLCPASVFLFLSALRCLGQFLPKVARYLVSYEPVFVAGDPVGVLKLAFLDQVFDLSKRLAIDFEEVWSCCPVGFLRFPLRFLPCFIYCSEHCLRAFKYPLLILASWRLWASVTHPDHLVELCHQTLDADAFHLHQLNTNRRAEGN